MPSQAVIALMGVCGTGKSTIGLGLSARLQSKPGVHALFIEGDKYHPSANTVKMASGLSLDDADRSAWLLAVQAATTQALAAPVGPDIQHVAVIVACSLLKRCYRDAFRAWLEQHSNARLLLVHLTLEHAAASQLEQRLANRREHFMPPALVHSQLRTLELPSPDESALTVETDRLSLEQAIEKIEAALG